MHTGVSCTVVIGKIHAFHRHSVSLVCFLDLCREVQDSCLKIVMLICSLTPSVQECAVFLLQQESLLSYTIEYLVRLMGFTVRLFNSRMCHFLPFFQIDID